jgi:hypothetical protein
MVLLAYSRHIIIIISSLPLSSSLSLSLSLFLSLSLSLSIWCVFPGFLPLARVCQSFDKLSLRATGVTNKAVDAVASSSAHRLRYLNLRATALTNECMEACTRLVNLRTFVLSETLITPASLDHIIEFFPLLERLDLRGLTDFRVRSVVRSVAQCVCVCVCVCMRCCLWWR